MKAFIYTALFGAVLATPLRYKPEACECVPNVRCPMVFPQSCECMAKAMEECQNKLPTFCPRPEIDERCAEGADTPSAGNACNIVGGKECSADEVCNGAGTCVKKDDPIDVNKEGCNIFGAKDCPAGTVCGNDGKCLAESEVLEQTCGTEGSAQCPSGWTCQSTVDPTEVADVPGKCKPFTYTPTGTAPTPAATSLVPFPSDAFTALPPVEPCTTSSGSVSLVPFPTDTFTALPPVEPSLVPFPTDTFTALPLSVLSLLMQPMATPTVNY